MSQISITIQNVSPDILHLCAVVYLPQDAHLLITAGFHGLHAEPVAEGNSEILIYEEGEPNSTKLRCFATENKLTLLLLDEKNNRIPVNPVNEINPVNPNLPFDATLPFDSVQQTLDYCATYPNPEQRVDEVVVANLDIAERGFAMELLAASQTGLAPATVCNLLYTSAATPA